MMVVVMVMPVMVMVVIIVVVIILHRTLYTADPCCRGSDGIVVEKAGIHDFRQVDICEVAFHDLRLGLKGADNLADLAQFILRHLGDLVEYDNVTELHLLYDEVLDVVLVEVAAQQVLGACKLVAHAKHVHNGGYAVQARHPILDVLLAHVRNRTDGAGNGLGFADAAGLDDDVVEFLHRHDIPELLHQVHLERAADAAVLESDEAVVTLAHHAVLFNEVSVDVHFADIVYDDGELDALAVGKYPVDESGLSASQIAGKQQYGCFVHIHCIYCQHKDNPIFPCLQSFAPISIFVCNKRQI